MVTMARRVLLSISLMFWQGGFTFYAGVVVPIGTEILGSAVDQGFITQKVTVWLNVAGVAAVAFMVWEAAVAKDPCRWRRWVRVASLLVMAGGLVILYAMHPLLDELLLGAESRVLNRPRFRELHRVYLWTSTVQWGAAVVWIVTQPWAWRAEDLEAV
jgi:hypothetical protein